MNVDQFVNTHEPSGKRHPLLAHQNEIDKLHSDGYSYVQIRQFLEQNGINVSVQSVARFVRRYIKKSLPSQIPTISPAIEKQEKRIKQQNQDRDPVSPPTESSILDAAFNDMNFERFL